MEKIIEVRGYGIQMSFLENSIHVRNNEQLWNLLAQDTNAASPELAEKTLVEYRLLFDSDLQISADSLAIEIVGHVYADYFACALEKISDLAPFYGELDKIIAHCAVIDSGCADCEGNRRVWDALAPYADIIIALLSARIDPDVMKNHAPCEN